MVTEAMMKIEREPLYRGKAYDEWIHGDNAHYSIFSQGGRAGRRGGERARRNLPVSGGAVDHSANLELRG